MMHPSQFGLHQMENNGGTSTIQIATRWLTHRGGLAGRAGGSRDQNVKTAPTHPPLTLRRARDHQIQVDTCATTSEKQADNT